MNGVPRTSFNEGGVLGSALSTYGFNMGTAMATDSAAPYIIKLQTMTGSTKICSGRQFRR